LENKLDPSTGTYPTPRNIRVRVSKQYLCITTFLECCRDNRSEIIALSRNARIRWKNLRDKEPLFLDFSYVADPNQPQIALPLRKIDTGAVIQHVFNYHGAISCHRPRDIPKAYLVTDHQAFIGDILERHHITWETLSGRDRQLFEIQHVLNQRDTGAVPERGCPKYSVKERREEYTPNKGDIMVRLKQPARRLIPLLLGLRSSSGFFTHPPYCQMNKIDQDFFIYSIPAGSPD
jgi:hypothetical protein